MRNEGTNSTVVVVAGIIGIRVGIGVGAGAGAGVEAGVEVGIGVELEVEFEEEEAKIGSRSFKVGRSGKSGNGIFGA